MRDMASGGKLSKNASAIVLFVFGSLNFGVILCVAVILIAIGCATSAAYNLLVGRATLRLGTVDLPIGDILFIILLPLILLLAWLYAHRAARHVQPHIREIEDPRRVKALIMFLSPNGEKDKALVKDLLAQGGDISDLALRKQFQSSWRMPVEAIAYHLERLEQVIVVASQRTEPEVDTFKALIAGLTRCHATEKKMLKVLSLPELDAELPSQVDFESVKEQNDVLNGVLDILTEFHKLPRHEIMIDITGGQKVCGVAGAMVALSKDWRVEYLSTMQPEKVKEYDITIETRD